MDTDKNKWSLLDANFDKIAILPSAISHFKFILNEPGSGSISIPMTSNSASVVTTGMFAVANYRGASRGGISIDNIKKDYASEGSEDGGLWMDLSGSGELILLEDGIVTGGDGSTRDFTGTKAGILITLIDEAKARTGCLTDVTYDFTSVLDSDGVAWTDNEPYTINVGDNLLEVLRKIVEFGIDFKMSLVAGVFILSAYKNGIGTDKSSTIFMRVGKNCIVANSDERAGALKNALLLAHQKGFVWVKDDTSIASHRRRERHIDARNAQSAASATTYGSAVLENSKDPKYGLKIKVYDGVAPYVFLDYGMGDTISVVVNDGTIESHRILGIQCDWDGNDYSNVVLELNNIFTENEISMAQSIDRLLSDWQTAHDAGLLEVSYWAAIGDPNISYSSAMMVIVGDGLYIVNGQIGSRMMRYNISTGTWEVVTIAMPNTNCMEVVGTDIYLGGTYGVYKFDTTTDTLSTIALIAYAANPAGVGVYTMAVDGTTLYIAGAFDTIDSVAANGIIKRNTVANTWSTLADEASFVFPTVASTSSMVFANGNLYANGQMWNGTVFSSTSKPGTIGFCYKMIAYGSDILIGTEDGLYIYDGVSWEVFGGTISGQVRDIAVYLTDIYIVGTFTDIGNRIARWSGGAWWELGTGLNNGAFQIELVDDDVYVMGLFTEAGEKNANNIAAYFNNFEALADYLENAGSSFNMGAAIHAATASAISDSDEISFWEDVANELRKITWANIKAAIKTYLLGSTSNTHVLFNDAGSIGGEDKFVYDKTTGTVDIGGTTGGIGNLRFQGNTGNASAPNTTPTIMHAVAYGTVGNGPLFKGIFTRGTKASPLAITSGDTLFRWRGAGYDGAGLMFDSSSNVAIDAAADENFSPTANGSRIDIYTTPNGSTTLTKVLSIGANGALTLTPGTPADGLDFLTFTSERPWTIQQAGAGAAAVLEFLSAFAGKYVQINPADNSAGGLIVGNATPGTLERFVVIGTGNIKAMVETLSSTGYAFNRLKNDTGQLFDFGLNGSARTGTIFGLNNSAAGVGLSYMSAGAGPLAVGTFGAYDLSFASNNVVRITVSSAGITTLSNTTDSTGNGTGALVIAGGVSIAKLLYVGTDGTNSQMYFTGGAGFVRDLVFASNRSPRWILRTDSAAESGSNAGSPFVLVARDDSGASLGNVFSVLRATKVFTFELTTDATSPTAGAVNFAGGVGIAKKLYVGTDFAVNGNTTLGNASTDTITNTGRAIFRTVASDPKHATPASRPAGSVAELAYYAGKFYICTNTATPTWELITSA